MWIKQLTKMIGESRYLKINLVNEQQGYEFYEIHRFSFFFFSSRRRHTRYWRDWSSDVCSSDLMLIRPGTVELMEKALQLGAQVVGGLDPAGIDRDPKGHLDIVFGLAERYGVPVEIGRASCRERV